MTGLPEINYMLQCCSFSKAGCKQKSHTGNPVELLRGIYLFYVEKGGKGEHVCSLVSSGILG